MLRASWIEWLGHFVRQEDGSRRGLWIGVEAWFIRALINYAARLSWKQRV